MWKIVGIKGNIEKCPVWLYTDPQWHHDILILIWSNDICLPISVWSDFPVWKPKETGWSLCLSVKKQKEQATSVMAADRVNAAMFHDWVTRGWPQIEFQPAYKSCVDLICGSQVVCYLCAVQIWSNLQKSKTFKTHRLGLGLKVLHCTPSVLVLRSRFLNQLRLKRSELLFQPKFTCSEYHSFKGN